jgi:hypothetical protein
MLEWTQAGGEAWLMMLVLYDDANANTPTVLWISMKNGWKRVFPL